MASRLNRVADQVENALETYRFDHAAHVLYQFVWHEFCDWYIELAKLRNTPAAWRNLAAAMENALRLLHPFMPFITEELWQRLTNGDCSVSISVQDYPRCDAMFLDDDAEKQMEALQEAIAQIRNARVEMKVDAKQEIDAQFYSADPLLRARAEQYAGAFSGLARTVLEVLDTPPVKEGGVLRHTPLFTVRIPYAGAVDPQAERARLTKELAGLLKQQTSLESQLGNPEFLERAPKQVVEGMRVKLGDNNAQQHKIQEGLQDLEG
jgi:valyl-tRNA synthetase